MLLQLLESRRVRRFAGGALVASLAVHAASFGAAARPDARERAPDDSFISIRYLLPPDRVAQPRGERIQFVAVGERSGGWLKGADQRATVDPAPATREPAQAALPPDPVPEGDPPLETAIFTEDQVDSVAARDPNSGGPNYPDVLRIQGVQGEVLVEFAVDTSGHADPTSFAVVQTSHPLFAEAVREALPRMLFTPAVARGHRVRQLVRLPMKFRIFAPETGTM